MLTRLGSHTSSPRCSAALSRLQREGGVVAEHSRRPSHARLSGAGHTEVRRTRVVTAKFAQRSQIPGDKARRWADKIGDGVGWLAAGPAERDRKDRAECEGSSRVACSRSSSHRLSVVVASIRCLWMSIPATAVVFHFRQLMPSSLSPRRPSRPHRIPPTPSGRQSAPAQARSSRPKPQLLSMHTLLSFSSLETTTPLLSQLHSHLACNAIALLAILGILDVALRNDETEILLRGSCERIERSSPRTEVCCTRCNRPRIEPTASQREPARVTISVRRRKQRIRPWPQAGIELEDVVAEFFMIAT